MTEKTKSENETPQLTSKPRASVGAGTTTPPSHKDGASKKDTLTVVKPKSDE